MSSNVILDKSYAFAVKSVDAYKLLAKNHEYVLSKQFLRSSTSIGVNINEPQEAVSKADFINKLAISLKEARETLYWLKLLKDTAYLDAEHFEQLYSDCDEIVKILKSIILSAKQNMSKK